MKGTVYKSTGSWYLVKTPDGGQYQSRIKGVFKIDEDITSTNPIAVGDTVEIVPEEAEGSTAMITEIAARRNYIVRSSPHKRVHKHIVAANLDQAMLICTIKEPRTSLGFIDRFLVTAAAYHIPAILVFNKKDVLKEKDLLKFREVEEMYTRIGYQVLLVSAAKEEGITTIRELLHNKVTLMSGHSGVGKSSLINRLLPSLQLRTKEVSGWSGKGMHTTTFAEMFDLPNGGQLIDTPGIRELGIIDIPKTELSHYFLEMQAYITECQFNNCLHVNELGCAVKDAVEEGNIHIERYVSYVAILESMEEEKY